MAQVLQGVCFRCRPPGSFISFIPYSRLILIALMLASLAEATYVTIRTTSEVKGATALESGSIIDEPELVSLSVSLPPCRYRRAAGTLEQLRRRYGGESGAAAWQPCSRGSGGSARRAGNQ